MKKLLTTPWTTRNQEPIATVLADYLPTPSAPARRRVLEVASGTGQHVAFFARRFPHVTFSPSEYDADALPNIMAYVHRNREEKRDNMEEPIRIDATQPFATWKVPQHFDVVLSTNMIHKAPYAAMVGLVQGAAQALVHGGYLILYGPFKTPDMVESNKKFDVWLQEQDKEHGIRALDDVQAQARKAGLAWVRQHKMPANNLMIVFCKNVP